MTNAIEDSTYPSSEALLHIYTTASLIKICDAKVRSLIDNNELSVNYYSPRGQELVAACVCANLRVTDYLVTTYRGIHDQLAKGVPLTSLMAEYFGKVTGACKGKGGAMHITYPACGAMVTTGIVGSGMPIANGLALASQMRGDGRVTVVNFGDGATNIGAFGESLNLASLWRLPIVFVCQNNFYAEHTAIEFSTAGEICTRALGYGVPALKVDGNDPIATYRAAREAVHRARNLGGPTLIEATTFRFHGHNYGDAGEYIPKHQYAEALSRDPFPRYRKFLVEKGHSREPELDLIDQANDRAIDSAVEFAIASQPPGAEELLTDVYGGDTWIPRAE